MIAFHPHFRRLAALAVLMLAPRLAMAVVGPSFNYTGFGPGQWGTTDTTLGLTGYVLENFESTTLAAGLSVGWATTAGNTITSLQLVNGRVPTFGFNDGFVIDHLAFAAIPEPISAAKWLALGAGALMLRRRWWVGRSAPGQGASRGLSCDGRAWSARPTPGAKFSSKNTNLP